MADRRTRLTNIACLLAVALGIGGCGGDKSRSVTVSGERWPEADALFHQEPRWLGSDGAYSVPLEDGRILWLFGDTLVATTPTHVRSESAFIRNSIGIQHGSDPSTATMRFYWREIAGAPASYFAEDGDRWFWPKHGLQIGETLVVVLNRIRLKPNEPCCFNFANAGWRLAIVDDVSGEPDQWRVKVVAPPAGIPAPVPEAGVSVGEYAVFLAQGENFAGHLVRWRLEDLASGRLSREEWWAGPRGWVRSPLLHGPPSRIIEKVGPEASLHFDSRVNRWVLVWTEGFGPATVVVSFASSIEGPWSAPVEVYHPPEGDRRGNLIYAGKGHPELDGADLPVTYVASKEYYPRFVKLRFTSS